MKIDFSYIKEKLKEKKDKLLDKFGESFTNISYLKKAKQFVLIDGISSMKIKSLLAIKEGNKLYIKTKTFEELRKHLTINNMIMNKESCELFEIVCVNKTQPFSYEIQKTKKIETITCYIVELKKITKFN